MWKLFLRIVLFYFLSNHSAYAQSPRSGGYTTVSVANSNAYSKPVANLSLTRRDGFFIGNAFFKNPWVSAPSSTSARDGLGPLFNTNACQSCHVKDGRGRPPINNEVMTSMLVRVSLRDAGDTEVLKTEGVIADPNYGNQIQNRAIYGIDPEATVKLEWEQKEITLNDSELITLRTPKIRFSDLAYGPIHENAVFSLRVAPAMIGIGLLELVPDTTLLEIGKQQSAQNDGVSGRRNRVWDVQLQKTVPGRFGWKAGQPTVRQQVAAAFAGDIGATSSMFTQQPCTSKQTRCLESASGGDPEVSDEILDFVTFYSKTLAVPARRNIGDKDIQQGEILFREVGCNTCHVEILHTGVDKDFPELSNQEIHAYTDLLLHDMGEGLADHSREFLATGSEWRTPPLWGIGLMQVVNGHTNLLHDGRARNVEEAILWHGGEAESSHQKFIELSKNKREQIIKFINSL